VKINEKSEKGKRRMEKGREEYYPHTGLRPGDNRMYQDVYRHTPSINKYATLRDAPHNKAFKFLTFEHIKNT
jgi:hypothetical protein